MYVIEMGDHARGSRDGGWRLQVLLPLVMCQNQNHTRGEDVPQAHVSQAHAYIARRSVVVKI